MDPFHYQELCKNRRRKIVHILTWATLTSILRKNRIGKAVMASKKDAIGSLYASRRYLYFPFHGAKQRNVEKLIKIPEYSSE